MTIIWKIHPSGHPDRYIAIVKEGILRVERLSKTIVWYGLFLKDNKTFVAGLDGNHVETVEEAKEICERKYKEDYYDRYSF